MSEPLPDLAEALNASLDGWSKALGLRYVRATADEVVGELEIGPQHHQPYGIVHGGVHASLVEGLASVGGAIAAGPQGRSVVGLENHTTFVRAAREGLLRARATPITRGRTTQVWEVVVQDAQGRTLATGRVRLLCLAAGADLAGEKVKEPAAPG